MSTLIAAVVPVGGVVAELTRAATVIEAPDAEIVPSATLVSAFANDRVLGVVDPSIDVTAAVPGNGSAGSPPLWLSSRSRRPSACTRPTL